MLLPQNIEVIANPDNNITWFVREGRAVDVIDEKDAWIAGYSGMTATGEQSRLNAGHCVGTGDFEIFARVKIDDISKNNASLMFDAAGALETGELIFVREGNVVVRGFFFGDRTQRVCPVDGLIHQGEWFDVNILRVGDIVTFKIAGETVWTMRYENERPFGKLTLKPGQSIMTVYEFGLKGLTTPIQEWIPRLERNYPIRGDGQVDLFSGGEDGYHTYRIPAIVKANSGALLAFAEGRKYSAKDHGDVDIVLRRSEDSGHTWQSLQLVYGESGFITIGNPVPLVDKHTGRVWLFFCRDNKDVLVTYSDDEGVTWQSPIDLTSTLKLDDWGSWYATGPCHGIQLSNGRLIVPANHGLSERQGTRPHMIYSDDHGTTWEIGGIIDTKGNETTIAEIEDNRIYVNMRSSGHNNNKPYCRKVTYSFDGGDTFEDTFYDYELIGSICQGSVLGIRHTDGSNVLLFSNPKSQRRERMTVRASRDNGKNWSKGLTIYEGSSAYSDLVQISEDSLALLFERDLYRTISFVTFSPEEAMNK